MVTSFLSSFSPSVTHDLSPCTFQIQRLPFLPSSNLGLDTLRGSDDCIGFDDILNGEDPILLQKGVCKTSLWVWVLTVSVLSPCRSGSVWSDGRAACNGGVQTGTVVKEDALRPYTDTHNDLRLWIFCILFIGWKTQFPISGSRELLESEKGLMWVCRGGVTLPSLNRECCFFMISASLVFLINYTAFLMMCFHLTDYLTFLLKLVLPVTVLKPEE